MQLITIAYAFGSVIVVSAISLVGAATLSLKKGALHRIIFFGVSLSVGALFGDALFHLIPSAFETLGNSNIVALLVLVGIMAFFVLEKFLAWQHCHHDHGEGGDELHKHKPMGIMVLISDGIHNFIDGIVIGASYLVGIEIGIATTLAIILHEIPQEIGNFGVLLHAGFTRARALLFNFFSGLTAVFGTALALALGSSFDYFVNIMIAITAGSFMYIAGSDLVPELHKDHNPRTSFLQMISIAVGATLIFAVQFLE